MTGEWIPADRWSRFGLLALLVYAAYVHVLWQPLLEDDYIQIDLGRNYGPMEHWPALAADELYRSRATSIWLTHATESWFGIVPSVFYATMLLLHLTNTWLVEVAASAAGLGSDLAFAAAAYFAVQAGHQEAVMWYAALPELLVFTFTMLFLLAWMAWMGGRGWGWGAAALALFAAGLASKESAVVAVPLAALLNWRARAPMAKWLALGALAMVGAGYAWAIFAAQDNHLHLNDGTFSLSAPFWITLRNSAGRLLWVWGAVSLVAIVALRQWAGWKSVVVMGALWIVVTFMPYVFLTYMPRVPSRHTYLASAGLALVVGAGWLAMSGWLGERRRWAPALLAVAILASEAGYIWAVKRPQILARAAATEALLHFARQHEGPIYLQCFPVSHLVAGSALRIVLRRPESELLIDPRQAAGAPAFCYGPDSDGGVR